MDDDFDRSLRPPKLEDFVNQVQVTEQLGIFIEAARRRGEPLDHVLLAGPPGLGKTSLAHIIAAELSVPMVQTAGPALERKADIAAFLTSLEPGSVFFIDEIHRLGRAVEETLYPAMEDRQPSRGARSGGRRPDRHARPAAVHPRRCDHPLRPADDSAARPLRRLHRLEHYDATDLRQIVLRSAGILGIDVSPDGAEEIASRARGTPRVANRLLRRVRDFAEVKDRGKIDAELASDALEMLEVDRAGLDRHDRQLLQLMASKFGGGPVGLSTLAVAIGEEADTIEDVFEPYLLQQGLVKRTPRGRVLTERAYEHLGLPVPEGMASLF